MGASTAEVASSVVDTEKHAGSSFLLQCDVLWPPLAEKEEEELGEANSVSPTLQQGPSLDLLPFVNETKELAFL